MSALHRPRIARGGILLVGDGVATARAACELGEVTVVAPDDCAAADFDRRTVAVASDHGTETIAYAELVIAPAASADLLARRLALPLNPDGRILVDPMLRVAGVPHVWALGEDRNDARALGHRLRGTPVNGDGR